VGESSMMSAVKAGMEFIIRTFVRLFYSIKERRAYTEEREEEKRRARRLPVSELITTGEMTFYNLSSGVRIPFPEAASDIALRIERVPRRIYVSASEVASDKFFEDLKSLLALARERGAKRS